MKTGIFFSTAFLLPFFSFAQTDHPVFGSRAIGMGNNSLNLKDQWALFNNPGAMARLKNRGSYLMAAYDNRFGMKEFQTFGVGYVMPLMDHGALGFSISRYGDLLYSEQKIGVAYSHSIENASLGFKINYLQVSIQELGSSKTLVFEFGGHYQLLPSLSFAAMIYNFSSSKLKSQYEDEKVPLVMKAGLMYHPVPDLIISVETEKEIDQSPSYRTGIEYSPAKKIFFRTGFQTSPFQHFFGLGFHAGRHQFDYAMSYHPKLGINTHLSFSYRIGKTQGHED